MPEPIHGLIAAVHTPFHADGRLHLDVVARQAEYMSAHRMAGVFVCGTTGESLSLSAEERCRTVESWMKTAPKSLRVIVHVGAASLGETQTLARHAQDSGAHGISAMAPIFFRPKTVPQLVEYCRQVASAAPKLPFYYYHIPSMTGVTLPVAELVPLALEEIPNFAGVKYTHNDLYDLGRAIDAAGDRAQMLFGLDEMLLGALALGIKGGVGGTYQLAPQLYHDLLASFAAGKHEEAQQLQATSRRLVAALLEPGGMPAIKFGMKLLGIDCGPVRPPLSPLSPQQEERLRAEMSALKLLP